MQPVPGVVSLSFVILVAVLYSLLVLAAVYSRNAIAQQTGVKAPGSVLMIRMVVGGWILLTGLLGVQGFFVELAETFPGIEVAMVIAIVFAAFEAVRSRVRLRLAQIPQWWIIGAQTFRLILAVQVYALSTNELVPRAITFQGRNFDLLVGITAPFLAAFVRQTGEKGARPVIIAWNILGLLLFANATVVATLARPVAVLYLPFVWLPTVVVPFAAYLHLISLRKALTKTPQA